eukprot:4172838-Amphidinium_carterae.1
MPKERCVESSVEILARDGGANKAAVASARLNINVHIAGQLVADGTEGLRDFTTWLRGCCHRWQAQRQSPICMSS